MDDDQYSLDKLRDIVIPEPPPLWPLAPGMWVLLGLVFLTLLLITWQWRAARKRNAYRKAGLALLNNARSARDISVLVKRVALAAFPRESVASLYGDEWAAFLNKTCPRGDFSALSTIDPDDVPDSTVISLAATWIRHHRVPDKQTQVAS
jgi:hypothetical protein